MHVVLHFSVQCASHSLAFNTSTCGSIYSITFLVVCRRAAVAKAVEHMVTKKAAIEGCKPGGEVCGCMRVRLNAHRVGYCPMHGPNRKPTLHDDVCREVIDGLSSVDPGATCLPQCPIETKRRRHYVDVVVVLSDGNVFAIEVDGRSHSNKRARKYDNAKDASLRRYAVKLERIDLQGDWENQIQQIQSDVSKLSGYEHTNHVF